MTKRHLLASSASIEGIESLVNEYYYSLKYTVDRLTLAINHPEKQPRGVEIIHRRGRYRFEMLAEAPVPSLF